MADSSTVGQRIAQLIQHLGISKNAFAVSLEKTATVIQHLVEERNKPGFDLLCKIFEVYPNVSKDWLLQGAGPMLSDAAQVAHAESKPGQKPAVAAVTTAPANTNAAAESSSLTVQIPVANPAAPVSSEEPASLPTAPAPALVPPAPGAGAVVVPSPQPVTEAATAPVAALVPAAAAPVPAVSDASWQTALYTQQMAHQLALAELRNQHLQEQQRLMQQMMDLMQRQITR